MATGERNRLSKKMLVEAKRLNCGLVRESERTKKERNRERPTTERNREKDETHIELDEYKFKIGLNTKGREGERDKI